jgi:hypothetical protein
VAVTSRPLRLGDLAGRDFDPASEPGAMALPTCTGFEQWARLGSHQRPLACERGAARGALQLGRHCRSGFQLRTNCPNGPVRLHPLSAERRLDGGLES